MSGAAEVLAALIPPLVMAGFFVALVVTVMRATDWRRDSPEERHDPSPDPDAPNATFEP